MTIYKLYIKIHRKTGLRYLGQTKKDPKTYQGSGVDWTAHLAEYGNDVDTEIILETNNINERNHQGRYYSALWKITTAVDDFGNKIWANRIPETGGGGGQSVMSPESVRKRAITQTGTKKPASHKKKCSDRMKKESNNPNSIYKSRSVADKKSKSMIETRKDKTADTKFNTAEYHIKIKQSCIEGAKKFRKHYILFDPNGKKYDITGLTELIKNYELNKGAIYAVMRGEQPHHKGWTGYIINE